MSIYKFLIATTLVLVSALLIGGFYYPNSLVMYLVDTSPILTGLKIAVAVLLFSLLVTNPPRSRALRTTVGGTSVFLFIMTAYLMLTFQMFVLDAVVFLQVAILFGIEALETRRIVIPVREKRTAVHKVPVYTS